MAELKVFAGRNSKELAHTVCNEIGVELGRARTNLFPDGEVFVKLDDDVRGRDCYVVISTCDPVNDNLMELLVFCDCLRRASAKTVTMVMPYYGYGRQDRKDEGRVPITAKLVANLITASRADRVLAMDLHAAQIQGFFDIPVDHLSATPVFFDYFESIRNELSDLCLVSPDVGNVKVAEAMANLLDADLAIINKRRLTGDSVKVGNLIGDVRDKTVLMFDDMISTGGTVVEAAKLVMDEGAKDVICAATHAVLAGRAMENLANSPISKIVVTDTIPTEGRCDGIKDKLVVLSVGEILGQAIKRIHENKSISELFVRTAGAKR
ncbi:MAG: ribose-phosphate pyrophosphokinase [Phycisphaerales bacterium]|nr:ribose-phosphate pyrophosphokinase [Phycisphaerales bacterium]